jgi:transcriptional regulator with XRE-family HTH domain
MLGRRDGREAKEKATVTEPGLTPAQLLAARKLLGWSRDRLAGRMGISNDPIARFEREGRVSKAFDARKAREILEAAAVEFETGGGAAVSLRKA